MNRSEFDRFADEYCSIHRENIAASGEAPEYFADYKMTDLARLVRRFGAGPARLRVLDFGAGVGTSVPFFRRRLPGASLTCVDVSLRSLRIAIGRFPSDAAFVAFDGARLPFADGSFDWAFAACVFHHIAATEHVPLMAEIRRVLRPGGRFMVYEHNPLNPLTRRAVDRCPFDEHAVLIGAPALRSRVERAGFTEAGVRYRVFFPRALSWLRPMEDSLARLPVGAQYYVHAKA